MRTDIFGRKYMLYMHGTAERSGHSLQRLHALSKVLRRHAHRSAIVSDTNFIYGFSHTLIQAPVKLSNTMCEALEVQERGRSR